MLPPPDFKTLPGAEFKQVHFTPISNSNSRVICRSKNYSLASSLLQLPKSIFSSISSTYEQFSEQVAKLRESFSFSSIEDPNPPVLPPSLNPIEVNSKIQHLSDQIRFVENQKSKQFLKSITAGQTAKKMNEEALKVLCELATKQIGLEKKIGQSCLDSLYQIIRIQSKMNPALSSQAYESHSQETEFSLDFSCIDLIQQTFKKIRTQSQNSQREILNKEIQFITQVGECFTKLIKNSFKAIHEFIPSNDLEMKSSESDWSQRFNNLTIPFSKALKEAELAINQYDVETQKVEAADKEIMQLKSWKKEFEDAKALLLEAKKKLDSLPVLEKDFVPVEGGVPTAYQGEPHYQDEDATVLYAPGEKWNVTSEKGKVDAEQEIIGESDRPSSPSSTLSEPIPEEDNNENEGIPEEEKKEETQQEVQFTNQPVNGQEDNEDEEGCGEVGLDENIQE